MSKKVHTVLATALAATAISAVAQAAGPADPARSGERSAKSAELELVERPVERFERAIEAHKLHVRYRELLAAARRHDVAPRSHVLEERLATDAELREGAEELERQVKRAKREAAEAEAEPELGAVAGVSQATLDAIAACESGGDPTAVNPAGYYGKYQFDMGTWASVGGSGNPAAAPEAEQDYRAALLYSRAGSSPWPVCGG